LITKAQDQPSYKANAGDVRLDVYRALLAAGVKLTPDEASSMAREAARRGLPNEVVTVMQPMADQLNADQKKQLDDSNAKVKADKASLAAQEKETTTKGDAAGLASLGEAYLSYGDYAKAVQLIQAGLTKGISDPGKADVARLHLGIAQLRAGQKEAALATFGQIKSDNGTYMLAKAWVLIAAKSAA
jgi:tetratricopeptide (TPR) repeat protein